MQSHHWALVVLALVAGYLLAHYYPIASIDRYLK